MTLNMLPTERSCQKYTNLKHGCTNCYQSKGRTNVKVLVDKRTDKQTNERAKTICPCIDNCIFVNKRVSLYTKIATRNLKHIAKLPRRNEHQVVFSNGKNCSPFQTMFSNLRGKKMHVLVNFHLLSANAFHFNTMNYNFKVNCFIPSRFP